MAEEKEAFLDRWSRLKKRQEAEAPLAEKKEEPPPQLPPVENLTPESDFKPFMDPRVDPAARRGALKALFADSHFKAADPFEPYSVDLTGEDPIPDAMLKTLNHAKRLLFDESGKATAQAPAEMPDAAAETLKVDDVTGKQDA